MDRSNIIDGLNLWMQAFVDDPSAFEAEFETVARFQAEKAAGQQPTYGEVGLQMIERCLAKSRQPMPPKVGHV